MRGIAAAAALTALALVPVAEAKPQPKAKGNAYGHQQRKAAQPAPATPPTPKRKAAAQAPKPVKPKTAPAKPRKPAVTTTSTTAATTAFDPCKADPGSCTERGGGNSGDIDPYRGPDDPSNTPARGNDCDEGGGNNRSPYPRRTNPNSPGDSPVDNDRGQGNNRCGGVAAIRPKPGKKVPELDRIEVLGVSQAVQTAPALVAPSELEPAAVRVLDERGGDPERGGGVTGNVLAKSLPFTGGAVLAFFVAGSLMSLLGFGLRQRVGA